MRLTMDALSVFAAVESGNNDIIVSVISGVVALGIAYITYIGAEKYKAKKAKAEPKDRVELLFERYEAALEQKDSDNDELRALLREAQEKLVAAEKKLNHSYYEQSRLKGELERMKAQYHDAAKLDQIDRDNIQEGLNQANKRNNVQ